ncbi:MAG: hypothetical protein CMB56_003255 [Methanobacteriota archaeon]|nr:MAG: hypothetical protein CMB56_003255 [Euryarchaeota archaeon]
MTSNSYIYLEHDGKILLVDSQGVGPQIPIQGRTRSNSIDGWMLRLPSESEIKSMGINWKKKGEFFIKHQKLTIKVTKGIPEIEWPHNWAWKDNIISDSAVHPVARESVYRSIHRLVSKVIIKNENEEILMAKVKRGHFTGSWTLPGGYIDHDEHPRLGAARETLEELGIQIDINESNSSIVSQKIFSEEGISFVSFTYLVTISSRNLKFKLKEDEIESVKWFEKREAVNSATSWFDSEAIKNLI